MFPWKGACGAGEQETTFFLKNSCFLFWLPWSVQPRWGVPWRPHPYSRGLLLGWRPVQVKVTAHCEQSVNADSTALGRSNTGGLTSTARVVGAGGTLVTDSASQVVLVVKNQTANSGDLRYEGLMPGLGRPPRGGHGNPLQYSCLRIPWTEEPGGLQSMGLQRVGHKVECTG